MTDDIELKHIAAQLDDQKKTLARIDTNLRGNGKPGLNQRMDAVEEAVVRLVATNEKVESLISKMDDRHREDMAAQQARIAERHEEYEATQNHLQAQVTALKKDDEDEQERWLAKADNRKAIVVAVIAAIPGIVNLLSNWMP